MARPLLYLVRHGETKLNDEKPQATRGWLNVPLNDNGRKSAAQAGKFFEGKPFVSPIHSSDLQRAMETASHISPQVRSDFGLRPWDVGDVTGVPLGDKEKEVLDAHMNKTPDRKIKGGESFNDFLGRWGQALHGYLAKAKDSPSPLVLVTHSRNVAALPRILSGDPNKKIDMEKVPDPGSVTVVNSDHTHHTVFK